MLLCYKAWDNYTANSNGNYLVVLRFACVSGTLLWLASTQSTFTKFFRCSQFSEFDSKSLTSREQGYWRCFLHFLTRIRLHISYNSLNPLGVQQQGYQRCFLDKPRLHYICDAGYPPLTLCNLVGEGIGTPCLFASCLKVSNMFLSFSSTYLQNKCVIERHPLRVEVVTQSF